MDAASGAAVASAIIAALAACISLWQAWEFRKQVRDDRTLRLVEATIAQSPYLSESYQTAALAFVDAFGPMGGSRPAIPYEEMSKKLKDPRLFHAWSVLLNHWGRLAAAYYAGALNRDVAKQMYSYGFVVFLCRHKDFFDRRMSKQHYENIIKLYEEWKE